MAGTTTADQLKKLKEQQKSIIDKITKIKEKQLQKVGKIADKYDLTEWQEKDLEKAFAFLRSKGPSNFNITPETN